jgi:hypothetical protein
MPRVGSNPSDRLLRRKINKNIQNSSILLNNSNISTSLHTVPPNTSDLPSRKLNRCQSSALGLLVNSQVELQFSSQEQHSDIDNTESEVSGIEFKELFRQWSIEYKQSRQSVTALLKILKSFRIN